MWAVAQRGTSAPVDTAVGRRARKGRDRAARRAAGSRGIEVAARAGLAARAALYLLISALAARVATGDHGERADKDGALEAVARQPLGRVLVALLAVGFGGYALWRLVKGVLDPGPGKPRAWPKRLADVGRAALYAGVFVTTVPFVFGSRSAGSASEEADLTARFLRLPLGRAIVAGVGLGLLAAGAHNGLRGARGTWRKKLESSPLRGRLRSVVTPVAVVGLTARMVMFGLLGVFLIRAALQFDAGEAVGIDGALKRVAAAPAGVWLLGLLAVGLAAYGLYLLVEARYREVPER